MMRAARRWLSVYPSVYLPFRAIRRPETVVQRDTDLLIDGFPRSSNTWTEVLIREAGEDRLKLAHHAHAAAHVIKAHRLGVPSVVLFRDPDDAVVSVLTLLENRVDARSTYLDYVRFYKTIWPLRGPDVTFLSFDDLTNRSAEAVAYLAERFGLPLSVARVSDADGGSQVYKRLYETQPDLKILGHSQDGKPEEGASETGARLRAQAREAILSDRVASARAAAREIYAQMHSDLPAARPAE
jgi:hypothetical protein